MNRRSFLSSLITGMSARLLVLTMFFVMLSEVLIYVPSIARFRLAYFEDKLRQAHLATLALKAAPDYMVSTELEIELLNAAGLRGVVRKRRDKRSLVLWEDMPPEVEAMYDLTRSGPMMLIVDAFDTLRHGDRVIRVVGAAPGEPEDGAYLELIMNERPLYEAMRGYSVNILALSVAISLITAALVYLSLHWLMVRPMRRITASMIAFRKRPNDINTAIAPSQRRDEVGMAQRELARMQEGIRASLLQQERLAALGAAVAKVNHDLRNMLAAAHLISDRLAESADPAVRKLAPRLVQTIDRAIDLCTRTLNFGRADERPPHRAPVAVHQLIDDVTVSLGLGDGGIKVVNATLPDAVVEADREQLYRVLMNLCRNAAEAMQSHGELRISSTDTGEALVLDIADTGPGLPEAALSHLFEPFTGSARRGGTGLGLVIARDLVRGHGGELELVDTGRGGTTFRIVLPHRQAVAA